MESIVGFNKNLVVLTTVPGYDYLTLLKRKYVNGSVAGCIRLSNYKPGMGQDFLSSFDAQKKKFRSLLSLSLSLPGIRATCVPNQLSRAQTITLRPSHDLIGSGAHM